MRFEKAVKSQKVNQTLICHVSMNGRCDNIMLTQYLMEFNTRFVKQVLQMDCKRSTPENKFCGHMFSFKVKTKLVS